MSMLQQASATEVDMEDDDLVDYLHQLQEGIFEAYTGVLQGLRADSKSDVFLNYVQGCLNLLVLVSKVTEQHGTTDDLLRAAVGVALTRTRARTRTLTVTRTLTRTRTRTPTPTPTPTRTPTPTLTLKP